MSIKITFGHKEIRSFNRVENGKLVNYGYSITYDRDGNEISRTEPESYGSLGWDDGSEFTENDYYDLGGMKIGGLLK